MPCKNRGGVLGCFFWKAHSAQLSYEVKLNIDVKKIEKLLYLVHGLVVFTYSTSMKAMALSFNILLWSETSEGASFLQESQARACEELQASLRSV